VSDTFDVTVEAFNIAERYQTPVIILSDQEVAQRKETVDLIDTSRFTIEERRAPTEADLQDYARYRLTEDGVSPMSRPGMKGGNYQGAGIEHNEHANPTASGKVHAAMNEKRFRKLAPLKGRRDLFHIEGNPNAKLGLVAWGSIAGICREAFARAQREGLDVKLLVPWLLYPVAEDVYRDFFASVRSGLVVELSHQGQLYRILRMFTDVPAGVRSLARSGANPFQPQEILDRVRNLAVSLQQPTSPVSSEE
jgi:2-oxoglutarate ferredoxin oxidoreductase subunit alpha